MPVVVDGWSEIINERYGNKENNKNHYESKQQEEINRVVVETKMAVFGNIERDFI